MRWADQLRMKLWSILRRDRMERDLDEELRDHIEREVDRNLERGMAPAEARAAAMREFGGAAQIAEECRDARGVTWLDHFLQDLRYAARILTRNPGFSVVAVLALGLGIGANAAMFSVIDAVLLRPLPFPFADRLVSLNERQQRGGQMSVSWPDYLDWAAQSRSFERMAAWVRQSLELTGGEKPVLLGTARVTSDFFDLTGARPQLGRLFENTEDRPGGDPVVVLTNDAWRLRFNADPSIVGRGVRLSGKPYTVVGVLAAGTGFFGRAVEIYAPLGQLAADPNFASRQNHPSIHVLARRKPDVKEQIARTEIDNIMQRLEAQYPQSNRGLRGKLVSLADERFGELRPVLLLVFAAVGLVLLIASANVANLLLARAVERRKEFAIRTSLGAGRGRVVRQMLTESLLLALAGAAAGLLFARLTLKPILRFAPNIPRIAEVQMDWRVLLFCLGVAVFTAVLFGLLPAMQSSRLNLTEALSESGRSNSGGRSHQRLRSAFLVAEVALAALLVVSAGLVTRSLIHALRANPGFNATGVVALEMTLKNPKYDAPGQRQQFLEQSLDRLRSIPGVASAGAVMCPPLAGDCEDWFYSVSDHAVANPDRLPITIFNSADPEYFRTLQIPLLAGRFFAASDGRQSRRVVIVNEAFVSKWWTSASEAIGKSVRSEKTRTPQEPAEIVGVVGDTPLDGLEEEVRPEMFFPTGQRMMPGFAILVRTSLDPQRLEQEIAAVDADLPVRSKPMVDSIASSLNRRKFGTILLLAFGTLALVLASIGIYGVMSYSVMRRAQEIGIRIAVGATRSNVVWLIVGQGWRLTLAGIALGLAAAAAASRLLEDVLFGVSALDLPSFAVVGLILMLVALLACYLPARKVIAGCGG